MVTRSQIKEYASLKDSKARSESGLFIAEGHKTVREGLASECPCEIILVREGFFGHDEETDRMVSNRRVEVLDEGDFLKVAGTENPQGVVGIFGFRNLLTASLDAQHIIVLFDIADPRNVGTIIRSADWFGFPQLLVGETCVDIFNDKVVRSTMGSIFHCRYLRSADLLADLAALRPAYSVITADLDGVDYRQRATGGKSAFVFSNEARGPSEGILAITDQVVTIPGSGEAESLNVSCAASIVMAAAR